MKTSLYELAADPEVKSALAKLRGMARPAPETVRHAVLIPDPYSGRRKAFRKRLERGSRLVRQDRTRALARAIRDLKELNGKEV